MGWSYNMDRSQTKADFLAKLDRGFSLGYTLVRSQTVGKNHWQLVRHPEGHTFIALCLTDRGTARDGHGWGWKGMDESWGPCEVNCPLSMLNEADPPRGENAAAWREQVRQHHARKAARPTPAPGMLVDFGGHRYRLDSSLGPRKGWRVTRVSDGCEFRMRAAYLARAEFVDAPPPAEPSTPDSEQPALF